MISRHINLADLGYSNSLEFWQRYGGSAKVTAADAMDASLSAVGIVEGTLGDRYREWCRRVGGLENTEDSLRKVCGCFGRGLTFFKNYGSLPTGEVTAKQLNADLAVGSPVATFTADYTSKTSTWIDDDGVIHQHSGTDNLARVNGGYYDETGFHQYDSNSKRMKGLMVEAAGQNLLVNSTNLDLAGAWDSSDNKVTIENDGTLNPDGTTGNNKASWVDSGSQNLYQNFVSVASTVYTYSFFVKPGTAGNLKYSVYDVSNAGNIIGATTYSTGLSSGWNRVSVTFTTPEGCISTRIYLTRDSVSTGTAYFWGAQVEASPYATSFIPTTTASLSRPAETLSYLTSGNRTAATESIFMGFAPGSAFANDGVQRQFLDNDDKRRTIDKENTGAVIRVASNSSDSGATTKTTTTTPLANVFYIIAASMSSTGDPNLAVYLNGSQEGTDDNDDFTVNAWGATFYVGVRYSGTLQLNSIIHSLAFYADAKTATPVSQISSILGSL